MSLREIDLKSELTRIRTLGFVPAIRSADSAVGDTLESLLGLRPTNKPRVPDCLYQAIPTEVKAHREGSRSQISLFACEARHKAISVRQLVQRYGWRTDDFVKGVFIEVNRKKANSIGLRLAIDPDDRSVQMLSEDANVLWRWPETDLARKIASQLVTVNAEVRRDSTAEKFWYKSARLYRSLRPGSFLQLVEEGSVVINIRARFKRNLRDWKNRGTAFRLNDYEALLRCYDGQTQLV